MHLKQNSKTMTENTTIEKVDFEKLTTDNEYVNCTFKLCNFAKQRLTDVIFEKCHFMQCDFSLARPNNTRIDTVRFSDCKMVGIDFTDGNRYMFSTTFERCNLSYSFFCGINAKGTRFDNCNLQEANFDNANLTSSTFDDCELLRAIFINTNLEKTNFGTARNYTINPSQNRLKKAHFSRAGIDGLLAYFGIVVDD